VIAMTHDTAVGRSRDTASGADAAARVIVVAVDGSPSSWDAFAWAAGAAARGNRKLVVVHVMPLTEPAAAFGVPFDYSGVEAARQEISAELKDEAVRGAGEVGVPISFVTEHGEVTHAITEVARAVHAELVVVGRSAKVLHRLAGSLSHRLTCRNDAPVVVVVP
jgi:nucleotide-binding universal stress UspA family protein